MIRLTSNAKLLNGVNMFFRKYLAILLIFFFVFALISCKSENPPTQSVATIPILTTTAVSGINKTIALSGGSITSDGGASISARGVCWSTNSNPTITDNGTNDGSGTGVFVSNVTGLLPNTTYYVRAYATNSAGSGYGAALSFITLADLPELSGPYVGQTIPGNTAKVFAPGFICMPNNNEFTLTFSPDGNEIYFYRIDANNYCKIFFSKIVIGKWTEPKEFSLSNGYNAMQPHVTPDNKTLYFLWNVGSAANPNGIIGGVYACQRNANGEWDTPKYAGQGMYLSSSKDGQLYTTDTSELLTAGKTYLAKVKVQNGLFTEYERLDIKQGLGSQAHPCIATDGNYILFDTGGGSHLFVSFKKTDGTWGDAIDITTKGFDIKAGAAYISPDGKYLFYHLNDDIHWVSTDVITNLK
ncbi:MAG: fibronectin type III domain-containing protein [Melioribacteraceae bacterium]